jgi:hypothetical protein
VSPQVFDGLFHRRHEQHEREGSDLRGRKGPGLKGEARHDTSTAITGGRTAVKGEPSGDTTRMHERMAESRK